jgi:hypothetical protein
MTHVRDVSFPRALVLDMEVARNLERILRGIPRFILNSSTALLDLYPVTISSEVYGSAPTAAQMMMIMMDTADRGPWHAHDASAGSDPVVECTGHWACVRENCAGWDVK